MTGQVKNRGQERENEYYKIERTRGASEKLKREKTEAEKTMYLTNAVETWMFRCECNECLKDKVSQ